MGYFDKNNPVNPPNDDVLEGSDRKPAALQQTLHSDSASDRQPLQTEPSPSGRRAWRLWHLYGALVLIALVCFAGASYSAFTAEQLSLGQVVFNNSLTPLFRAGYQLAALIIGALVSMQFIWPELFNAYRSDKSGLDLNADLRAVSPETRLWLFVTLLSVLCWVATTLLTARPPESVSVGP